MYSVIKLSQKIFLDKGRFGTKTRNRKKKLKGRFEEKVEFVH